MKLETFFKHFDLLAEAPNGVQKLRELILDLAVRGKLVPQDANDEPAAVLLERIKKEKERLVKEKKIKNNNISKIDLQELPYLIPRGWQWIRLGEVILSMANGIYKPETYYSPDGIGCLRMYNIHNGKINLKNLKRIMIDEFELEQYRLSPGDLLVNRVNSRELVGKSAVIEDTKEPLIFESKNIRVRFLLCKNFSNYINILLQTSEIRNVFEDYAKQTTGQASINQPQVANILVPLPPVNEQKRIVTKVDELMKLCDELEARQKKKQETRILINNAALNKLLTADTQETFTKNWQRISDNFDLLYSAPENIGKLRQAILQLAVMGKLVPQDANDEPAAVLLERIKKEKERLVKEGKIKKEKFLPAIKDDEIPFDLPIGWKWVRFPELGIFGRGKSKHRPRNDVSLFNNGKYPVVQTGDVARANKIINTYTGLYNENGLAQSRIWPKGTLCITIAANIADAAILGFDACFPDSVVGFIPSNEIGKVDYFGYFMKTAKSRLQDYAPSTAQKNINIGILEKLLIPLPPLNEQKRIVSKVDKLMKLCDELETKLTQTQTESEKIINAAVKQLLTV